MFLGAWRAPDTDTIVARAAVLAAPPNEQPLRRSLLDRYMPFTGEHTVRAESAAGIDRPRRCQGERGDPQLGRPCPLVKPQRVLNAAPALRDQ